MKGHVALETLRDMVLRHFPPLLFQTQIISNFGITKLSLPHSGDSRNETRPAKVVVVANTKQKVVNRTHNVVKYTPKNFYCDNTLYDLFLAECTLLKIIA